MNNLNEIQSFSYVLNEIRSPINNLNEHKFFKDGLDEFHWPWMGEIESNQA